MKHFIGGWAAGTLQSMALIAAANETADIRWALLFSAFLVGPLVGLMAWGLLP